MILLCGPAFFSCGRVSFDFDGRLMKSSNHANKSFCALGPYATAVLRFQISFPDLYPKLPPLVTFSTDIFHPLVTPLTTYMYTTDIQDNGTVSATDDERLPPGGFSLRHGFPAWFGRGSRSGAGGSRQVSAQTRSGPEAPPASQTPPSSTHRGQSESAMSTPGSKQLPATPAHLRTSIDNVSTYEVLCYIQSVFDEDDVLDAVPLEAAGNPGAWHAWRTRQQAAGKPFSDISSQPAAATAVKGHAEWNWEGVWEVRVKKNIAASLSEPVLYGSAGVADDVVSTFGACHRLWY